MKEPKRYVFYAEGHRPPDVHPRLYVPVFTDLLYARAWYDEFVRDEELEMAETSVLLGSGIRLRCEQLDQVLGNMSGLPELKTIDRKRIMSFKHGWWDEPPPVVEPVPGVAKALPRPVKQQKQDRPPGYVTITDLAASWGVQAMHCRAALRASGREKPEYGWAFDPKEVPTIKKICGIK